jgi:hypothetical protein
LFEGRLGLWRVEFARQGTLVLLALFASLWLAPTQALVAQLLAIFSLSSLLWLSWLAREERMCVVNR